MPEVKSTSSKSQYLQTRRYNVGSTVGSWLDEVDFTSFSSAKHDVVQILADTRQRIAIKIEIIFFIIIFPSE